MEPASEAEQNDRSQDGAQKSARFQNHHIPAGNEGSENAPHKGSDHAEERRADESHPVLPGSDRPGEQAGEESEDDPPTKSESHRAILTVRNRPSTLFGEARESAREVNSSSRPSCDKPRSRFRGSSSIGNRTSARRSVASPGWPAGSESAPPPGRTASPWRRPRSGRPRCRPET